MCQALDQEPSLVRSPLKCHGRPQGRNCPRLLEKQTSTGEGGVSGPGRSASHGEAGAPDSGARLCPSPLGLVGREQMAAEPVPSPGRSAPATHVGRTDRPPRGLAHAAPEARASSFGCQLSPGPLELRTAPAGGGQRAPHAGMDCPRPPRCPRPTRSRSHRPPAPHPSPPATAPGHTIPQTQPKMCTPTVHTDPHEDTPFQGYTTVRGHPQLHDANTGTPNTHARGHTHTHTHAESPVAAHAGAHARTARSR